MHGSVLVVRGVGVHAFVLFVLSCSVTWVLPAGTILIRLDCLSIGSWGIQGPAAAWVTS
jgi:hypothetical protein